jgi:carbon monoxide dehydrogenase subunit G
MAAAAVRSPILSGFSTALPTRRSAAHGFATMALQTAGEISVDVDRPTAFAFVKDPARLARCIPGCKDLHELSPNRYEAVLSSKVAFMTMSFKVIIEVLKMQPPESIEAKIAGDAVGLSGRVAATAAMNLTETGPRQTLIRYVTDISLTGKLGGIGQPVFRATSAQLAREFNDNLKAAIEGEPAPRVTIGMRVRRLLAALWRYLRRS